MPFKKGQSGNPGGRKQESAEMVTAKDLARKATIEAVKKLLSLMRNSIDEKIQILAANSVLDRGLGKAAQEIMVGSDGGFTIILQESK